MKVPEVISENNLSYAWGRAFLVAMSGSKDLMPLTISIGIPDGLPIENIKIREAVDAALTNLQAAAAALAGKEAAVKQAAQALDDLNPDTPPVP